MTDFVNAPVLTALPAMENIAVLAIALPFLNDLSFGITAGGTFDPISF